MAKSKRSKQKPSQVQLYSEPAIRADAHAQLENVIDPPVPDYLWNWRGYLLGAVRHALGMDDDYHLGTLSQDELISRTFHLQFEERSERLTKEIEPVVKRYMERERIFEESKEDPFRGFPDLQEARANELRECFEAFLERPYPWILREFEHREQLLILTHFWLLGEENGRVPHSEIVALEIGKLASLVRLQSHPSEPISFGLNAADNRSSGGEARARKIRPKILSEAREISAFMDEAIRSGRAKTQTQAAMLAVCHFNRRLSTVWARLRLLKEAESLQED